MIQELKQDNTMYLISCVRKMRQDNYFNDMEVLHYALSQAENEILNYIHQDSVPGRLENVWIGMTNDLLDKVKEQSVLAEKADADDFSVKSIKMGDTTIEKVSPYEMIQRMKQVPSSLERYKRQLNRFRKLL
uniref:Head to tail adaptor n=1 Tax=Myoviridae sp. ctdv95 TaxID=2825143 RepID=A0A8S5QB98_9CAUD|nr:MAG TPA: head to tail adaptor [Myoviridae sp. ctdv95]DAS20574.1 MAG TPA: head to tail adaptor [Caudoviricetes sp.]